MDYNKVANLNFKEQLLFVFWKCCPIKYLHFKLISKISRNAFDLGACSGLRDTILHLIQFKKRVL